MGIAKSVLFINAPYLNEDQCNNIRQYEYKGGDRSYVYRYIYSPICERCVKCLPMWLA